MLQRFSAIAASIVTFTFLFVSITHACSGLTPTDVTVHQSPMNMDGGKDFPCNKQKGDICQSVRDSILSVKPSISAANSAQQTVSLQQFFIDSPIPIDSLPAASATEGAFPPGFKPPLTVSYIVLRI